MRSQTTGGGVQTQLTGGAAPTESGASSPSTHASSAEYIVSGIKQHKLAVTIALIALAAVVGLGIYLKARNSEVAIESIAVLPFQNRSTETDTRVSFRWFG